MKVSFDFDGTLEFQDVQEYAQSLIKRGIEVWIVTTRYDSNHDHKWKITFPGREWAEIYSNHNGDPNFHVWGVAEKLCIPKHHVRFTCMQWKYTYLNGTQFVWHLDDNAEEIMYADENGCNVPIINVESHNWTDKCDRLIQDWIDTHQTTLKNEQ